MKNKPVLILLTLLGIVVFCACKKNSNSPTPTIKNNLAFIYDNDSSEGVAFKTLLQQNGCSVTLLDRSKAGIFDYSGYAMILIGNNTDTLHGAQDWNPSDAMTIKNTGKPILLIGEGGALFAGDIQDTVNWGTSAGNILTGVKAFDPTSVLYKQPKLISVGADSIVTLYSSASRVISFYAKSLPVHEVAMIGIEPGYSKYYPVLIAGTKFGSFGFYSDAGAMTATGKDFFVNLVYYVGGLTP